MHLILQAYFCIVIKMKINTKTISYMKTLLLSLMASLLLITAKASDKSSTGAAAETKIITTAITGRITDKLTGEALAGVEVKLLDSDKKAYTDFDGNFEITNVVPGAHAIKVGFISYQDAVENVYAGKSEKSLEIKLKSVQK